MIVSGAVARSTLLGRPSMIQGRTFGRNPFARAQPPPGLRGQAHGRRQAGEHEHDRCDHWVPIAGISSRLKASAPTIAPTVLAA